MRKVRIGGFLRTRWYGSRSRSGLTDTDYKTLTVYRLLLDQAGGNKVTQEELAESMGISRRKFCSYVRELKDMYKEYVAACT